MREFTTLENKLFDLFDNNNIHEDYYDICATAFSTDEAMQNAIDWLKDNPNFTNVDISKIIGKFGVESENFSLTTVFEDESEVDED